MKYLTIPNDIKLVNTITKEPLMNGDKEHTVSFFEYVSWLVNDPRWSPSAKLRIFNKIEAAIEKALEGDRVAVLDDEWLTLLSSVAEEPSYRDMNNCPIPGIPGCTNSALRQLIPFVDAIEAAKKVEEHPLKHNGEDKGKSIESVSATGN